MADSTKDYLSTLNDLIETCKDGEQGFRDAADGVKRADLKSIFNEYARQRTQFANELQRHVMRLGGDPETSGSATGAMHRGWLNLKSAITGKDDEAILNEAERGEDVAVESYQSALERDLPSDLRAVVEDQYQQILQAHNQVKALRDGADLDDSMGTRRMDPTRNRVL
jgi:uncharacterized protein (TIGR02284 family)